MANKRNANEVRLLGVARRGRAALALTTALQASAMMVLSLPAMAQPPSLSPNAQPQGGTTVAGNATISQTTTTTTINQTSQRAALNWQSFNVGSQQTVNFQQPSASAVALNRVVGPDPSQIAGRINANGQVVLVNQSGVVFTQGAQVNAAGLLVSTAGITNQNFMAGAMKFDQPGNPNARIENAGNITVKQAGLAALVAPQVANSGTITATLGHVVLAGAKTATLDMYGDGLVALDVTNQVTQVPIAADGTKATALVTNTGTILAAGGTVQLTARAADGVVQTLVNAGGKIATPSLGNSTGTISLNAIGGSVIVEGQLSATGDTPGSTGGAVGVLATSGVGVAAGAKIDVSGKAGGGMVAVGTTLARAKGGPSVKNPATARNVVVQQGATIKADATVKGNGGRVTVLSGNVTRMDGAITAKGGPQGGNGGFVEVSGNTLGVTTGSIVVSAPQGTAGTVLFDPIFLDIDNIASGAAGTEDQNFFDNGGTILVGDGKTGTPDTISANAFGQLSGDVLLQAQQTISVNASFSVNLGSLTLQAGSRITVNSGATASADTDVTFQIVPSLGTPNGTPLISILGSVVSNGGGVTLLASPGGSVNIGAAGGVRAEETNVSIQADSLTVASPAFSIIAAGGIVEVAPATAGTQVTFAGPGGLELTQGFLDALDTNGLRVGAVTLNGTITTTAGTIAVANVATLGNTSELILDSTGPVTEAAGAGLSVGQLYGSTGAVGLVGNSNSIALLGAYVANGGDFAMTDTSRLTVGDTLTATSGNVYLESSNANGILVGNKLSAVKTSPTGTASFQTDELVISQGSKITTGTFELAPDTIGSTLEPGNLTPATLTNITSNFVRLGAVTEPGDTTPTTRAGEVLIDSNFDFLNRGVELDATGPIDASGGTLTNVATLSGTGTAWTLTATTNTVSNLGAISAGSFTLLDNIVLSVIGTLNATVSADIDNTAGVTIAGAVKAPIISLQGSTLAIPGLVSDGGAGSVNIVSSAGAIGESGSIVAGTLSGNAAGTVTLTGSNSVATLSNFFAPSFTMTDTPDLAVAGTYGLRGGANATITDTGTLTVLTTVSANSISLTGASIAIPGLVTDGGVTGGNVALIATAGGISEAGSLFTTTLSGSATGAVTLTGTNTVANLGNFTANGFTFTDTGDLAIGGSTGVSGGASASITATGVVSVNSGISATSVGLTANAIQETGTIVAGTLSGSATGVATLTGSNTIGTVGNFAANGFTLIDTGNLAIGGTTGVAATTTADISTSGTLTVTSTVSAATVGLTGAAIAIGGLVTDGGTGSVSLIATAGGIAETGTLVSGNLSGSATGPVALTGSNDVGSLNSFTSDGFTLIDTGDLSTGNVAAGSGATITDAGTITVNGNLSGTAVSLEAASIQIYGVITDGGAGTVALVATAGDVVEPEGEGISGQVIAGTLAGSASGALNLLGDNTIAAVGNFTANSFDLFDTADLTVNGTTGIKSTTDANLQSSGTLTVASAIVGTSGNLTATALSIPGLVSAGTGGPLSLDAAGGSIAETGTLIAGTLSGSSTGAASLTGNNTIAILSDFSGAGVTLHDTGNLNVTGTTGLSGGIAATIVDTGTLTITAGVFGTATSLTGAAIAIPGRVSDGGSGTVALIATGGTIDETGALTVGTLSGSATGATILTGSNVIKSVGNFAGNGVTLDDSINLAAGTGANGLDGGAGGATIVDSGVLTVDGVFGASIDLTANSIAVAGTLGGATSAITLAATNGGIAGAGTVVAASLAGTSTAATSLTGPNTIAAVGNFAAAGFTLDDTGNLAIAGTTGVSAGANAAITTTGTLTVTSTVSASAVGLTGGAIAIDGLVTDGGTGATTLTATAGGMTETGTLVSGNLSGSATGAISLTGSNTIQTVGDVTANGFTLADTGDLTVGGANGVQGGAGATITDTGTLFVNTTVSGTAVSLGATAISILGLVTDGGAGTVVLTATGGNILESTGQSGTGRVIAGTLTGSATGAAIMNGHNTIAAIGDFAPDGLSLFDTIGLTVNGTTGIASGAGASITTQGTLTVTSAVTGTSVDLTATSMSLAGLVSAGTTGPLTVTATAGDIAGAGTLVAGTFDGTATGAVNLTGANTIGTVGDFTANAFTLDDTGDLTVAGSFGVFGDVAATIVDTGTLTIQTGVRAAAIGLTGGAVAIPGIVSDGGAGTVVLLATGGTISETGTLIAGTLSGSATGTTSLTGTNTIADVGNFSGNGVTIDDTGNLAAGTGANGLTGGAGGATIVDSGVLTVDGVFGTSIDLTANSIAVPGTLGTATSAITVAATNGGITGAGTIVAASLAGSSTAATSLTGPNIIAAVGNFAAAGFTLDDTGNLAIAGTTGVSAGANAAITTSGTLTVTSTVSASAVGLTGGAIAINGLVTDGGGGTVMLTATAGGIAETGTLVSGNLSGSATGAIALTGSNTIPIVGDVTAAGFTLNDSGNLTVAGTNGVQGGASTSITDSGTLSVNTTVSGTAVGLDAAAIFILGLVTDGGAGTVALTATGGSIVEGFGQTGTGRVIAGTLTGSATAAVFMNGDNTIAAVGNFAPDGLSLLDTIGLTVDGTSGIRSGAGVSVTTQGTLTVASAITGTSVDLTATSMSLTGLVGAGPARTLTLTATTGDIAGTGTLVAGTFDGTAAGVINLTGANTIATVGDVRANGFTLDDTGNLTVAGSLGIVGGIAATIVDTGTLTIQSGVTATAIGLTGGAIAIPGLVTDGGAGTVVLIATAGTIGEAGTVIAGTLSGSATGTTSLTGSNTIAAVGNFSGNGVTLDDSVDLAAGTGANGLTGGAGGATIVDSGVLTVDGVFGASIDLTANSIAVPGTLGTAATTVTLTTTVGGITETGAILAATLTGTASGAASLTGTNTIATVGNFSAAGFNLDDTGNLNVGGTTGVLGGPSAIVTAAGTLTVTSGISASAVGLTGGVIAIPGLVTDGGTGTVALFATAGGIGGAGTVIAGTLSGSAVASVTLTGSNSIATVGNFTANGFSLTDTGNLTVGGTTGIVAGTSASITDAGTLTVGSTVSASAVSLTGAAISIPGLVDAGTTGAATLDATAGGITVTGTLIAGTLSGSTTGTANLTSITNAIGTLNGFTAGGNLSLIDTLALTVTGLVSAGSPSAPAPANTATLALTGRGGLHLGVAGGASATLNAGTISLTANGTITEPNGALFANDVTAQTNGAGGDILLASATNQFAASSGMKATNGNVVLVDDPTMVLTGAYSGNNLFFEVNLPGGSIAVGGATAATLTVANAGRITLVADGLSATPTSTMTAPQGTIQLAPFSAIAETVLGTAAAGTLNLDATLLGVAGAGADVLGTLVLGAFTDVANRNVPAQVVSATSLTVAGTLSLSTSETSLGLFANGPIAESGGAITVATVFGTADSGNFTLASPHNAIATTAGITARTGDIVLVDGTDLTLTGLHSANNEFFEVAVAGGSLSVGLNGEASAPASLQAADGGRISLVADNISATGASAIEASGGTVELAPLAAINVSLMGTAGLALGPTLLTDIATETLVVGGFTNAATGATTRTIAAASVSVDGTTDLTGTATALVLDATGAITQPGGPLTVAQLGGTGASVSLLNAANGIGTIGGLTATAGNVAVADTGTLGVAGAVSATGNVYLTSNAVSVAAAGQVTGGEAGLASIRTDAFTLAPGATVTAGTFEFAPLAAGATLTLGAGGALVSLSGIDTTLARIGAVTLPGGATPTTIAGAIVVGDTFEAAGQNVELDATGAIVGTGTAGALVDVATLSGTGGAWNLTDLGNGVAQLGAISAGSFQFDDGTALSVVGQVSVAGGANIISAGAITVAASGAIDAAQIALIGQSLILPGQLDAGSGTATLFATFGGIEQTGTLIAGTLQGNATGAANVIGTNSFGTLIDFSAAGVTLADTGNLIVGGDNGVQGGASATITTTGTLTVASGVTATSIGLTAAALALPGTILAGGPGTVSLIATGGSIAQTGTLVAETLSGSATGAAALGGTNTVATLGNFTANRFALLDGTDLSIVGTVTAPTLSIHAPNSQITLRPGARIVTGGGNRPAGAIVAADEPANGAPGAYLLSRTFAQSGASFVTGTMQIGVTGNIAFDAKVGLQDTNGWLILTLTDGTATGDIFVRALDVSYTTPGAAVLTGRIDGVSGQGAAALANIVPATNLDFTFNGCTIGTVTCTIVTPPPPIVPVVQNMQAPSPALGNLALVPLLYSLQNVTPQVLLSPQDLDDLLQLPVVSEQDY
jgi:filamentous hemagglutinin family protein